MKNVLVTGTSTGIGRATALRLHEAGWRVFATVRRPDDAESLRQERAPQLVPLLLDVTDRQAIGQVAEQVGDVVGAEGLQGLVNNAGMVVAGPLEAMPLDRVDELMAVNVMGQVAVTQAMLPLLRQGRGRIVNVGSVGGIAALPYAGAYCASKFALEALTDALRMELKPWGIEVTIVEPGSVATPIWTKGTAIPEAYTDPEVQALYGARMAKMRARVMAIADKGIPPATVADVIHHALTARRPRTRYLVGPMARVRALVQKLPDRWRDRILLRLTR